jgi:hypothetical protein
MLYLVRSQDSPPTCILLLRALKFSYVKVDIASSVERFFLNPNCSHARMLFKFKKLLTVLYITFSNILENAVSNEIGL